MILWFSVHVHCSYTPSTKFFSYFTGHPVTRRASGLCVWVQPWHKALVHCRDVFGPRVLSGMGWQEESQTEVQDWCCTLQGQGHFVCVFLCNITWLCIIFSVVGGQCIKKPNPLLVGQLITFSVSFVGQLIKFPVSQQLIKLPAVQVDNSESFGLC